MGRTKCLGASLHVRIEAGVREIGGVVLSFYPPEEPTSRDGGYGLTSGDSKPSLDALPAGAPSLDSLPTSRSFTLERGIERC